MSGDIQAPHGIIATGKNNQITFNMTHAASVTELQNIAELIRDLLAELKKANGRGGPPELERERIFEELKSNLGRQNWKIETPLPSSDTKQPAEQLSIDLRFVPIPGQCFWHVGKRGDAPYMQIETRWHVTNVSGVPVRLLLARLDRPQLADPQAFGLVIIAPSQTEMHSSQNSIPPGETWHASVGYYTGPPTQLATEPLSVDLVVIDQFANEHRLPSIAIRPTVYEPNSSAAAEYPHAISSAQGATAERTPDARQERKD